MEGIRERMIDGTERRRWEWIAFRTGFDGGAVRDIVGYLYEPPRETSVQFTAARRKSGEELWCKQLDRIAAALLHYNTSRWRATKTYTHLKGHKKALGYRRLGLELAVKHVLYIFLVLVPFLGRKDLEYLECPPQSPGARAISDERLTSIGGLRPNALARCQRCMRVVPMHGP